MLLNQSLEEAIFFLKTLKNLIEKFGDSDMILKTSYAK